MRPLATPLAFAMLCSPGVGVIANAQSSVDNVSVDNVSVDYILPGTKTHWNELALGAGTAQREAAAGRFHSDALAAPESWWRGLQDAVGFVGIIAGGRETSLDSIGQFAAKISAECGAPVDYVVGPRDVHDQPLVDFMLGRPAGDVTLKMAQWLGERFND